MARRQPGEEKKTSQETPKKQKQKKMSGKWFMKVGGGGSGGGGSILKLPTNILMDILSRLPVKTILDCRYVCNTWRNIILDPYFAVVHFSRQRVSLMIKRSDLYLEDCYLADFEACNIGSIMKFNSLCRSSSAKKKTSLCRSSNLKLRIVNSCNGLFCLCEPLHGNLIYISNPITGEGIKILQGTNDFNTSYIVSGFGFSPKTNQYKVLRVSKSNHITKAQVYTLGTSSWRNVGHAPNSVCWLRPNAFLNGILYWSMLSDSSSELICSFDIGDENFRTIPPPSRIKKDFWSRWSMKLGVLGGCLYICHFRVDCNHFDIWMLKDYGVKESWTKEFVIRKPVLRVSDWDLCGPIGYLSNGEIVMLRDREALISYNPSTRRFRRLNIHKIQPNFAVVSFIPSFFSLKDAMKLGSK